MENPRVLDSSNFMGDLINWLRVDPLENSRLEETLLLDANQMYTQLLENFTIEEESGVSLIEKIIRYQNLNHLMNHDVPVNDQENYSTAKYLIDQTAKIAVRVIGNGTKVSPFEIHNLKMKYRLVTYFIALIVKYEEYMKSGTYFDFYDRANNTRKFFIQNNEIFEIK